MNYIFSFLIGYLSGSIPTAYLMLKKTKGIDITKAGSGNVGAMNSLEVSNSKITGLTVLLIDALKGLIPVLISYYFVESSFLTAGITLFAAVLSHCYSPWIKFKGGRGLATAAGGSLFISFPVFVIWASSFFLFYLIKNRIHIANVIATFIVLFLSIIIPSAIINFSNLTPTNNFEFSSIVALIMILILIKHIDPIKDLLNNKKA